MRITECRLIPLPFKLRGGAYVTSFGKREVLNNVLLVIHTDEALTGLGEISRRSGTTPEPTQPDVVARHQACLMTLHGADPFNVFDIHQRLGDLSEDDSHLSTAIETACLDLQAQRAGVPLWRVLGGRLQSSVRNYASISQALPDEMAANVTSAQKKGIDVIQIKVGGERNVELDHARIDAVLASLEAQSTVMIDANGAFDVERAATTLSSFKDQRIYWEEPCATYEENADAVRRTRAPVLLDQCLTGPRVAAKACADGLVAGYGIKPTMQGGPFAARIARDLAIAHGLVMKVDDCWSADVGCALALHLALGVPEQQFIASVDMREYLDGRISQQGAVCEDNRIRPSDQPGIGFTADFAALPAAFKG